MRRGVQMVTSTVRRPVRGLVRGGGLALGVARVSALRLRLSHTIAAGAPGEVMPFVLADIGEGIAEVEVMQWFKAEGDTVQEFDALCEVRSDKAAVTITSPFDGVLTKVHYKVGDVAKTGTALVDIRMPGVKASAASATTAPSAAAAVASGAAAGPAVAAAAQQPGLSDAVTRSNGKVLATPSVRRMAVEHNLDLRTVAATGRDGRILKGDVLALLSGARAPVSAAAAHAAAAAASSPARAPAAASAGPARPATTGASKSAALPPTGVPADRKEPLRGIRKAMAKSMTPAASVPWFGYADEIEMDQLMLTRAALKSSAAAGGVKLTYMPFILKATALALTEYPLLNSSFANDEILYHGAINLGVAMDTREGLVVPNIKHVAQRSVMEIAVELSRLQALAQDGRLGPEDLSGGTFTISNIGNIGGTYLSPVPMPSEIAIGAIGRMRALPRFDAHGNVVKRHIMEVSWRADHRVVDGATMARFSEVWRRYLENPVTMIAVLR